MDHWKTVGVVVEGEPITVAGLNPWAFEWHQVQSDPVVLPHPEYPEQSHQMSVFEVESDGRKVRFAAGELSANIWGFYVPADKPNPAADMA